ncbi:MAG TPA: TPM domain-containing protein [Kiritimatiellia bacterium]|nr:TPM domain-containing protein [Kiritimatiellia bacterium]
MKTSFRHVGVVGLVLGLCFFAAKASSASDIPPLPADRNFIQDYADIISPAIEAQVGILQKESFEKSNTPIVVVTIRSMGEYNRSGVSIERLAFEWFNRWGIGKVGTDGKLYNQGILLLVSVGDRRARIELGADWGRRWDAYCEEIMDGVLVPEFKAGRYGEGIQKGVAALAGMAKLGPNSQPPSASMLEKLRKELRKAANGHPKYSPVRTDIALILTVLGVILILVSFFCPTEERKTLIFLGVAIIALTWFLWLVLLGIFVLFRGRGGSGGGFSSGGGFGGGSSGGGGASGGW